MIDTVWKLADTTFKVIGSLAIVGVILFRWIEGHWPWE